MRLLMTKCPYCQSSVETTMERLEEPIECPTCHKPFEMEMPTVAVTEVRDIPEEEARESGLVAEETGETTLITTHPALFRARPLMFIVVVALIGLGVYGMIQGGLSERLSGIWLSMTCTVVGLLLMLFWWIRTLTVTLTVTDSRTILRKGLLSRESSEVQHDDVRNIQLDQSMMERILHVGDIGISSSGQDDLEIVARKIPNPDHVVDMIRANQD